jgi:hypothetical protein
MGTLRVWDEAVSSDAWLPRPSLKDRLGPRNFLELGVTPHEAGFSTQLLRERSGHCVLLETGASSCRLRCSPREAES